MGFIPQSCLATRPLRSCCPARLSVVVTSPLLLHCLFLSGILPKRGHCPRLLNVVPSHKGCACDEDCPADHKCCVFDCGAVCVPPAFSKSHDVELLRKWTDSSQRNGARTASIILVESLFVHINSSFSHQPSQECVLADTGAPDRVLNFAPMTVTVPVMRSAATMDVDMSALHHTKVGFDQQWVKHTILVVVVH